MFYGIQKDDKPQNTVNRIKDIINGLNIKLAEKFFTAGNDELFAPVSLRLSFQNYYFVGTNGKGTCNENALASAYAEFIERLQNLSLFDYSYNPMSIVSDRILPAPDKTKDGGIKNEVYMLPFYSVKEKKICNLHYNIISCEKGTNGMAAGNTFEEAIVQGLSEVCERYALKEIFRKELNMPDIPRDEYLKYDNIKNIINYFEQNGFKITVKDASLDGKVPVVCTIIEDTYNNIISPSFGAHPCFPIAVERTLTEFAQGMMLSSLNLDNFVQYQCFSKEKLKYVTFYDIYKSLLFQKAALEKNEKINNFLLNKKDAGNYRKNAWVSGDKNHTNKELLSFLTEKILKISDDIYIRNVSFLGFPSVNIFVPKMSNVIEYNKENIAATELDRKWAKYGKCCNEQNYNIYELLKLSEIFSFRLSNYSIKTFQVPFEYSALLCSIVLKDSKRIIKYIDIIWGQNRFQKYYEDNQITIFKIIKDYYKYKKSCCDENYLKEKLKKKYKQSEINYAFDIIQGLTFDMVLDIVLKKNKSAKFRCKMLLKKLAKKYKENTPDQLIFKSIFDK